MGEENWSSGKGEGREDRGTHASVIDLTLSAVSHFSARMPRVAVIFLLFFFFVQQI